jgi:uncharacterized membrane protein
MTGKPYMAATIAATLMLTASACRREGHESLAHESVDASVPRSALTGEPCTNVGAFPYMPCDIDEEKRDFPPKCESDKDCPKGTVCVCNDTAKCSMQVEPWPLFDDHFCEHLPPISEKTLKIIEELQKRNKQKNQKN